MYFIFDLSILFVIIFILDKIRLLYQDLIELEKSRKLFIERISADPHFVKYDPNRESIMEKKFRDLDLRMKKKYPHLTKNGNIKK